MSERVTSWLLWLWFWVGVLSLAMSFVALLTAVEARDAALRGRPRLEFERVPQEGAFVTPQDSECLVRVIGGGRWHYRVWREDEPGKPLAGTVVVPQ